MLDFINSCYLDLINLTKTAPVFGGALMLWILGTISFLSRNIPNLIWNFLKTTYTSELDLTNTGGWLNEVNYDAITLIKLSKTGLPNANQTN